MSETLFDYYYGNESEQFSFFRIPKILFKDERFKKISCEAKLLYGLMLDRLSLSQKNGWVDNQNRVYIYYSREEVMEELGCAKDKVTKLMAELDTKSGIGLISKVRQGLGRPDIIYVKKFILTNDERPVSPDDDSTSDCRFLEDGKTAFLKTRHLEGEKTAFQKTEKPLSGKLENRFLEDEISAPNNTNINNTYTNHTESINHRPSTLTGNIECGTQTVDDDTTNTVDGLINDRDWTSTDESALANDNTLATEHSVPLGCRKAVVGEGSVSTNSNDLAFEHNRSKNVTVSAHENSVDVDNNTTVQPTTDNNALLTACISLVDKNIDLDSHINNPDSNYVALYKTLRGLICNVVSTTRQTIRIGGKSVSVDDVKAKFMSLKAEHLDYVIGNLSGGTDGIHNLDAYLVAALYNTPENITARPYASKVNHTTTNKFNSFHQRQYDIDALERQLLAKNGLVAS